MQYKKRTKDERKVPYGKNKGKKEEGHAPC
jgi:hypothetical protein